MSNIARQVAISAFVYNGDQHEKNFSFHIKKGKLEMSPIYDVLNTRVFGDDTMALPIEEGCSAAWGVDCLPDVYKKLGVPQSCLVKDLKIIGKILKNIKKNIGIISNPEISAEILRLNELSIRNLKELSKKSPPVGI